MSFKKNIAKYIAINPKQIEDIFNAMQNFLQEQLKDGKVPENKEIVLKLREFLSAINIVVAQQKTYEIMSMLLGLKNYNLALSKEVRFYKLFIESEKPNIIASKWVDALESTPDVLSLTDFKMNLNPINSITFRIPTGIKPLDQDLLGGLPAGGLTSILAGTNVGKSLFCISLGANALRLGKKVLHINLEGVRDEALKRYVSNLSNIDYSKVISGNLSKEEIQTINSISNQYRDSIKIRNFLGFGATIEQVFKYCTETYQEFKFDMIVVDYGQLLETEEKLQYRFTMAKVFKGLDTLAKNLNCVVVSPVQTTRNSQDKDKTDKIKIVRSADISEAFEIARVSSVILTLNSSPEEMNNSKIRVFLEKQRSGSKNKIYELTTNYSKCNLII